VVFTIPAVPGSVVRRARNVGIATSLSLTIDYVQTIKSSGFAAHRTEVVMSAALNFGAIRFPAARKFALSLLVVLPMFALGFAHAFGTSSAGGVQNPEFGYAEWAAK
jgi:hypothetical protein